MAFSKINNVAIRGISACVPAHIEENSDLAFFKEGEAERVIAQTGIERKHTVEDGTTLSDICIPAFNKLISELNWDRESIDLMVLVTSGGDYKLPSTANVLHGKLGLPESCVVFDINQGCPGWVVGMNTVSSMISTGCYKRAILLCGDLSTKLNSPKDKETVPLFGDAATATALEYDAKAKPIMFEQGSRGKDFSAIITKYGGHAFPVTEDSLKFVEYGPGVVRRGVDTEMQGMDVFAFGMSVGPKSIQSLCEHFDINLVEADYYFIHQANKYMNDKIRKKLKLDPCKVPFSIKDYGNTGGSSIPVTLVTQCNEDYATKSLKTIGCAFGVGLAWGSICFETEKIVCPEVQLYIR